jgi:hypothetical protein
MENHAIIDDRLAILLLDERNAEEGFSRLARCQVLYKLLKALISRDSPCHSLLCELHGDIRARFRQHIHDH